MLSSSDRCAAAKQRGGEIGTKRGVILWSNFARACICCNMWRWKRKKKLGCLLLAGSLCALWFCGSAGNDGFFGKTLGIGSYRSRSHSNGANAITVIAREDGSGTRAAFVSQLGIRRGGHDRTTAAAEVTQSTAVVLMSVEQNRGAIGYVSAMTPRDRVRTVRVNGALPSSAAVRDGSYPLRQEFYLVVKGSEPPRSGDTGAACAGRPKGGEPQDTERAAREFVTFAGSLRGQAIIAQEGYVPMKAALQSTGERLQSVPAAEYHAGRSTRERQDTEAAAAAQERGNAAGKTVRLVLAGSTAMAPLMQTLGEAFQTLHPQVTVEIQQTGSAAGITAVLAGACQIGMSSRALTETELAAGARMECIAADGIAVIVNRQNPIRDLQTETLRRVYIGEIERWENIESTR